MYFSVSSLVCFTAASACMCDVLIGVYTCAMCISMPVDRHDCRRGAMIIVADHDSLAA